MRNFQQQRSWKNILESKPFLIFFGIIILFFAWNIFGLWNKMQDTEKNKKIAEDQIINLEQQKEKLTGDINNLNTDQGKEEIFRENFGLAKEGENETVILNDTTSPPSLTPHLGFFGFLKNLFK